MTKSREWLLLNAVEAWLYHYERAGNPESVQLYKQLQAEFHDAYMQTLSKDAEEPTPKPTRKRKTNASQSHAEAV